MGYKSLEDRMKPSVHGVGILGANLELKVTNDGKKCKTYNMWSKMIEGCYSKDYHKRFPTYSCCYVSDNFKDYSKWTEWYDNYKYKQDGNGNPFHLDKDLLVKWNKVYSENTCVFLPQEINQVLVTGKKSRGKYLIGVYYHKHSKKLTSIISKYGKTVTLGYCDNEYDAFKAYKEAKESYIKELADKYKDLLDPRAYEALYNYNVDIDD